MVKYVLRAHFIHKLSLRAPFFRLKNNDHLTSAIFFLLGLSGLQAQDIAIDAAHFPDPTFRAYVAKHFDDSPQDGVLSLAEREAVNIIGSVKEDSPYALPKNTANLAGIEFFPYLTRLYADQLNLNNLDVSRNTDLEILSCFENQLTNLDVRNCTKLMILDCNDNKLTSLDLSRNTALENLRCLWNELKSLDLSHNTALTWLNCSNCQLTNLDVSRNPALEDIRCRNNQLANLDVSSCTALTHLSCENNRLESLNVSRNSALEQLICDNNQLSVLNISGCAKLVVLNASHNQLAGLDISQNTALEEVSCQNNHLALSLLHGTMKPRHAETDSLYVYLPQGDTKYLDLDGSSEATLDLRSEMEIGGVVTKRTISNLDGSPVPTDSYAEENGVFRFLMKGEYKLVLQNDAVTQYHKDANAFTWILKVGPYTIKLQAQAGEAGEKAGEVSGGGRFYPGLTTKIGAIPQENYRFLNWKHSTAPYKVFTTKSDTSFEVTEDLDLTAYFEKILFCKITTLPPQDDPRWGGSVSKGGYYERNTQVTVTATPHTGYRFVKWVDADQEDEPVLSRNARYMFTATKDLTLKAYFEASTYDITLRANNAEWGNVSRDSTYKENAEVEIEATPKPGYRFVKWTEGNSVFATKAKYTFKATRHINLTAVFEAIPIYEIAVQPNNVEWGSVSGGGTYKEDSIVEINATAKMDYYFVEWKNGNALFSKMKKYTFPAKANLNLTAIFKTIPEDAVKVKVRPNSVFMGEAEVSGDSIHEYGDEVTIRATAKIRHRFVNWKRKIGSEKIDFATGADTTFTVTENMELVAYFINMPPHTITVRAEPSEGGEVSGGGDQVDEGASVTISATPKEGWRFIKWGYIDFDGMPEVFSLSADTTFKATRNLTLTAYFEEVSYTITTQSDNADRGNVSGGGVYKQNAEVTISATAKEGYRFIEWKNGEESFSFEATHNFPATEDLTLTAYFEEAPLHVIRVSANDTTWGSVRGGGMYKENANATISATAKDGYRFVEWRHKENVFTYKADTTFKVMEEMEFVAYFEVDTSIKYYTIIVRSNNAEWGTAILGSGVDSAVYRENTEVTIGASPRLEKYFFVNWMKGNEVFSTQNIYTFTLTEDLTLTAYFDTEECDGKAYVVDRVIYLSESMGRVQLFNAATGQLLYDGTGTAFPVSCKGVYVIHACGKSIKVLVL